MNFKALVIILCGVLFSFAFVRAAPASGYTVNSTLDLPDGDVNDGVCATTPPGTPVCTLRAAVMQANNHTGPDFISVPAGTYVLTRSGYDATAALGDLDVTENLSIQASGGQVVVDANGGVTFDRAFEVLTGTLTLQGFTLQNGNTPSYGGAIYVQDSLNLINAVVQNNNAGLDGGGVYVTGPSLQISSSTFQGNTTQRTGGGASAIGDGVIFPQLSISGSVMLNNRAMGVLGNGGGVHLYAASGTIQNSTFRNNVASNGGGISYSGPFGGLSLSLTNTQVVSNSAAINGGGLYFSGMTSITQSQVISNVALGAGGIYVMNGRHTWHDLRVSFNQALSSACGGIENVDGDLQLNRGWIEANSTPMQGGGVCSFGFGGGRVAMTDTNVLKNTAAQGGGVWATLDFFAARSAIYYNSVTARGGGVYAQGPVVLEDTTLSGNSAARDGGGIYAGPPSTVRLNSVTLAGNYARTAFPASGIGGGVYISNTAVVSAANTLIGNNPSSPLGLTTSDCFGALRSEGYNFIGTNAGCTISGDTTGNQVGGVFPSILDPLIEPLAWLGGLTPGHLPMTGSPVINAGAPAGCPSVYGYFLFVDQIGHSRALDGRCDIGAVERFDIRRVYLPVVLK